MKFLVAVDGSEASEEALAVATTVAEAMDASITVVHAVSPSVYDEGGGEPLSSAEAGRRLIVESIEAAERRGSDVVEDAVSLAADRGHDINSELLYGPPVSKIADFAEADGFDAIFVGHRGMARRAEQMLGSVAKGLVERAGVPVTVVR